MRVAFAGAAKFAAAAFDLVEGSSMTEGESLKVGSDINKYAQRAAFGPHLFDSSTL